MSDSNGRIDWRDIEDTNVVFLPSDRVDPPIIDPKSLETINEAMEKMRQWFRECAGVEDPDADDPK